MQLTLFVIQGVPGAGKSTLKLQLAGDLQLPAIGKDDIKEPLFETLGTRNLAWKEMLGRAAIKMLYTVADEVLATGQSLIIENAFFTSFAQKDIAELAGTYNARVIEIYCHVDTALAKQRFIDREASGERHPGHRDDLHAAYLEDPAFWARYQPLDVGKRLTFDTTKKSAAAYAALLNDLRKEMEKHE
jgi:predicted kinase